MAETVEREGVPLEGAAMATRHLDVKDIHISISEVVTAQPTLPVEEHDGSYMYQFKFVMHTRT